ncbi:MAG: acyl-ACP thioesterase, partial [Calditrichaeota bacterium]
YKDLDLNRHANNVSYISWIEESLPMEFLQTHLPVELEIEFRAESVFGDRIVCQGQMAAAGEGNPQFLHLLLRQDDARELARARTSWRKI